MQIHAIFIVAHSKEYHSGRLASFLSNLDKANVGNLKVFLFMSNDICENKSEIQEMYNSLNLEIIWYHSKAPLNHLIFKGVMKYKVDIYKTILLLETDCALEKNFIQIINDELENYSDNIWIYGSYYYGLLHLNENPYLRYHMNGVGVYNRTTDFIDNVINSIDINTNQNWDILITDILKKNNSNNFVKKTLDSKHILNLSRLTDKKISIDYKSFKEHTCILHTKHEGLLSKLLNNDINLDSSNIKINLEEDLMSEVNDN